MARFNLLHEHQDVFFIGLPTTIAGCSIAAILINANNFLYTSWFSFFIAGVFICFAWLMTSTIRFPALKKGGLGIRKHYPIFVSVILFVVAAVMRFELSLLFLFIGYFALAFGLYIHKFLTKKDLHE